MSPRRFLSLAAFLALGPALAGPLDAQEGVEGVATGLGNRFIQTNTPLTNDLGVFEAIFTHRFNQAAKDAKSGGFWGLDTGATIGLGMEYVPVKNIAVQIYRLNVDADYEFAGKITLLRPTKGLPIGIGVRGGLNWLTAPYVAKQSSGFAQALVSATLFDRVTLGVAPAYVHKTPFRRDVWNVPVTAQVLITHSTVLVGEFVPKKDVAPNATYQWSAMIEKHLYHHKFGLTIGNTMASTIDQLIGGDYGGAVTDRNIHFGFNLAREFDFIK
jgi:hypothetical protein